MVHMSGVRCKMGIGEDDAMYSPYIFIIIHIIYNPTALGWSDGLAFHGRSDRFVQKHPPGPAEHFPLHAPRPSGFEARWTAAEVVVGSCQRLWTHPSLCDSHLVYGGDLENQKMVTVGWQKRQVRFNMKRLRWTPGSGTVSGVGITYIIQCREFMRWPTGSLLLDLLWSPLLQHGRCFWRFDWSQGVANSGRHCRQSFLGGCMELGCFVRVVGVMRLPKDSKSLGVS